MMDTSQRILFHIIHVSLHHIDNYYHIQLCYSKLMLCFIKIMSTYWLFWICIICQVRKSIRSKVFYFINIKSYGDLLIFMLHARIRKNGNLKWRPLALEMIFICCIMYRGTSTCYEFSELSLHLLIDHNSQTLTTLPLSCSTHSSYGPVT